MSGDVLPLSFPMEEFPPATENGDCIKWDSPVLPPTFLWGPAWFSPVVTATLPILPHDAKVR